MRALLVFILAASDLAAAQWQGAISDAGCAAKHANGGAEECVKRCVAKGAAPVLVTTSGQVLRLANPDRVQPWLGKRVTVTGQSAKGVVTVQAVAAR
ncbi:MAG: DUF5818 domain-containing protein [Bryobacteraceae bacterium]